MRIITVDTPLLCGAETGKNNDPEGRPADKEYAKWAWAWIERLLKFHLKEIFPIDPYAVGI